MIMSLSSAFPKLTKDCHDILFDAFKATFIFGDATYGDATYGDMIAERFASTGGPKLAQAIHNYVCSAEVVGQSLPGQTVQVSVPDGSGSTNAPGKIQGTLK